MRKDYFLVGLGSRLIMAAIFVLINQAAQFNDASEIIYYAFQEILEGKNPYSTIYVLHWGESTFAQPFNYGPVMLLLYLPAMILPFWYNSLWIGMTIMINVYCFLIAELLIRWGSKDLTWQKNATINTLEKDPRQNILLYYGGLFFWMIPAGTTCITVFIYGPIFLLLLSLHKLKNPYIAGLIIGLGASAYQILILMFPIFAIYYFKQSWKQLGKFCLGVLPVLLFVIFFEFWAGGGLYYSLIGYNIDMPYSKCPHCNNGFDDWSIFSIPRLLYNLSNGEIQIGPISRYIFAGCLCIICFMYAFTSKYDSYQEWFIVKYCIWVIIGFTLTTNYGQAHYLIFLYGLLFFYYQAKKPDFRKNKPIGSGIDTWEDYDKYLDEFEKIPL